MSVVARSDAPGIENQQKERNNNATNPRQNKRRSERQPAQRPQSDKI
jgi:hypothetical protein